MTIHKAGIECSSCGYMLLVDDNNNIVFCQNCKKKINPGYKIHYPDGGN